MTTAGGAGESFTVLVVCTANVCRSASAAALLARWARATGRDGVVVVGSAGVDAVVGAPICADMVSTLGAAVDAADVDAHRAAALTPQALTAADLVLAMDRSHRAACARLAPSCRTRLFTARQAAAYAEQVTATLVAGARPAGSPPMPADAAGRLRWLVAELDAARVGLAGGAQADEVVDRHGPAPHPEVAREVEAGVAALTTAFDAVLRVP